MIDHLPSPDNSNNVPLDWARIAEPQDDQYDTQVTLACATAKGYVRREVGDAPTCFDGTVAIRPDEDLLFQGCVPAPPDHPHIPKAMALIQLWPTVFTQCQQLLDTMTVFMRPGLVSEADWGSQCGPGTRGFGTIASTIDSSIGLAEAIVHEMGHHKLRALGIQVESAERLITNPPDQLYPSPIRYDCLRPMTAVIHAQYSYTYIPALDLAIIRSEANDDLSRRIAEKSLAVTLPKLEFGLRIIREHAQTDEAGAAFLAGFCSWIERILAEGFEVLARFDVQPTPFAHPQNSETVVAVPQAIPRPENPRRHESANAHVLGEEALLFLPGQDQGFTLNHSAKAIWELCDGQHSPEEITHILSEQFSCEAETLLPDVTNTLDQLTELGLIEVGA